MELKLEKFIRWGLYAAPLTLLLFYQNILYPFITVKTYLFYILIELLTISWLILMLRARRADAPLDRRYGVHWNQISIGILFFLLAMTISGLLGLNPLQSLFSTPESAIGLIGLWHFFAYYILLSIFLSKNLWTRYLTYLFWVAAAVSLFAILQSIAPSIFYVSHGDRPGGTLGNPAYLAGYLVAYLFLALFLAREQWLRRARREKNFFWTYASASGLVLFAFLNANTRGALLGLGLGAALALILYAQKIFKEKNEATSARRWFLGLLAAITAAAGIIYATHDAPLWRHVPGISRLTQFSVTDLSIANRLIEWRVALKGFAKNPILGVGFENFRSVADAYYDPKLLRGGFSETYFGKPHNVPLEILVTGGLVGLSAYLYLIYLVLKTIRGIADSFVRRLAFGALIAYFVQNLFIFDTFASYLTLFAGLAALSISLSPRATRQFTRPLAAALSGLGFVLCLALVFINTSILSASAKHYQVLKSFTLDKADQAMAAYARVQSSYYPFKPLLAHGAMVTIAERVQAVLLPNSVKYIDPVLADLEFALGQGPDNYGMQLALADARTILHRIHPRYLEGIDEELKMLLQISPRRQQTLYVRAKVKLLRNDTNGALADLQEAIALDPQSGDPHYIYGLVLFSQQKQAAGLEEIKKAIEYGRRPKNAAEYALLGGYFGDAEEYETAHEFFAQASSLEPENNEYLSKFALVSYYLNYRDQARELFAKLAARVDLTKTENYPVFKEIFAELGLSI